MTPDKSQEYANRIVGEDPPPWDSMHASEKVKDMVAAAFRAGAAWGAMEATKREHFEQGENQ